MNASTPGSTDSAVQPALGLAAVATSGSAVSAVTISARAAKKLRGGLPFVSRADVLDGPTGQTAMDEVFLRDERGVAVGVGLWAERGPIGARLWSLSGERFTPEALALRLRAALLRRQPWLDGSRRDAFRLVHGEADFLPGLFIDCYAEAAAVQTSTQAMNRCRPLVCALLLRLLPCHRVVCRDDGSARDLESLPRQAGFLAGGPVSRVRFHDAGSTMEADLLSDRKTGSFLDQQHNHEQVASMARLLFAHGKAQALDTFTYHGGFALALARAGLAVVACDEDPVAISRARHNAELTGVAVDFQVHNAFDLLRHYESEGRRFEVVVLDPPALAKRGRNPGAGPRDASMLPAMRGYKELNLRAMRLLLPGGLLVTCSCSGRVGIEDFAAMLRSAAQDSGRVVQLLSRGGASPDHPVLFGLPESEYLKCWMFRALS